MNEPYAILKVQNQWEHINFSSFIVLYDIINKKQRQPNWRKWQKKRNWVWVPEEGRDVMVKRVANNGVHDVEEEYRKLLSGRIGMKRDIVGR